MERAFLELIERNQVVRVAKTIERAVEKSFAQDGACMTGAEIRRRFVMCERIFRHLRGDLSWGLVRALDRLPYYLRCELDGQRWEPDKRTIWMPEDGN